MEGSYIIMSLLASAINHGDLSVKLSSLKQAKDILLSLQPNLASEILPYFLELQSSPECIVRKSLIKAMEDIGSKDMRHCYILMPVLLEFLKDSDTNVAMQAITSGTHLFCLLLEELVIKFNQYGKIERWLEEIWMWMVKFKDSIFDIAFKPGSVGTRLLGMKFLETYVLLFTSDSNNFEKSPSQVRGNRRVFNISQLAGGHPILDPVSLIAESNRCLGILHNLLQSSSSLPASLTIAVVNCLAAIARKRPIQYNVVLSALLKFDPNSGWGKGDRHTASILYSVRSAFLGFLRCPHPDIIESRDRLIKSLLAMNAGDAADQVIRQVEKMTRNNERSSRGVCLAKENQPFSQLPTLGDNSRKRSIHDSEEQANGFEMVSKRIHYGLNNHLTVSDQSSDLGTDHASVNGTLPKAPLLDSGLTPAEQILFMITALLEEGERGAESLEILTSNIHPDLLADIVITNMKHFPKSMQPLTRPGLFSSSGQSDISSKTAQVVSSTSLTESMQLSITVDIASSETVISTPFHDLPVMTNSDCKRDPRRDPRRMDPRRATLPAGAPSTPIIEDDTCGGQPESNLSISLGMPSVENTSFPSITKSKSDDEMVPSPMVTGADVKAQKEDIRDEAKEVLSTPDFTSSDVALSTVCMLEEGLVALDSNSSNTPTTDRVNALVLMETDELSPSVSNTSASEEACNDLPPVPSYVELSEEQLMTVKKVAIERIINSCRNLQWTHYSEICTALLARLVAQIDANDDVVMLQKNIILDYQQQRGHELVLQILYHLYAVTLSNSVEHSSFAAAVYEKFLLAVVKSLLYNLPASDKSFSRLLGEVPLLPISALKLLDNICRAVGYDHYGKDIDDLDRVIQGLGVVWSLILKRPPYREACLNIALECAIHSQDEIRSQAIRLVANKLYVLSYTSEKIENFATNMLLLAVNCQTSETELSQVGSTEQKMEWEVASQETSISASQVSEHETSEIDSLRGSKYIHGSVLNMSFRQVQRLISLYFALCTKKPSLLQSLFDNYERAPQIVKQAFCRHIPILVRALGPSCSELLRIISDPPQGSENLLSEVLNVLTEGKMPSSDLIAIVKHLYETKLKDASILIPMLSSLTKNEVLPIFPRLVELPLDKFQLALAHILQGSAHTGPALTPSEVLVAIHDINPEKDGLPLKKITDACSACFEQRTVFTQQVLAKSLNHMLDQTPLPLLYMRTVIQAIDAFPSLVDFVMEILSKLVSMQVWKMPKLWFGFLKCIAQTRPHSFSVMLQLPPPQLESALHKYVNLRGPLAAYVGQPNIKSSLPRSILAIIGLVNESRSQKPQLAPSVRSSDASSSVHGATST